MASYDNLMAEQPWQYFRPAFSDSWISDVFTRETETLTKALQSSISGVSTAQGDVFSVEMADSMFVKTDITPPLQTPTVSGVSENDSPVSKQSCRSVPPTGRVTKRKSRTSKRAATTTFITADPANFRRMVQQVTGVRFAGDGGLNEQLLGMLKPEPYRAVNQGQSGCGLPTLESSAFFLDGAGSSLAAQPSAVVADGGAPAAEHYFDSFCSFPTLESWKAM